MSKKVLLMLVPQVLAMIASLHATSENYAWGQVVGDNTLESENSLVTSPTPGEYLIEGGATRGTNLFHSFSQFSVPTTYTAYFNNGLNIQNIITRVTGGSISNIDGLIKANGSANLFLLNPNGIILGPNATLAIGGSFIASTASRLLLADGTQFSATNPQTPPLLTVSVPIGLQFGENPGSVVVQGSNQPTNRQIPLSSFSNRNLEEALGFVEETLEILNNRDMGLKVNPSETLALVGGDVVLQGGSLTTRGGRIEIGSVAGLSLVNLIPTDKGWTLGYEDVEHFQNIQLSTAATINASGVGGGDIQIQGGQVSLTDQTMLAALTFGNQDGGDLFIRADELTVERDSIIGTGTTSVGNSGNLTIETQDLTIQESLVQTGTGGSGDGGDLKVQATDSVNVVQQGFLLSGSLSSGIGGNLTLETGRLIIQDGSIVNTGTFGTGSGGNLVVLAQELVEVSGIDANGKVSLLTVESNGEGNAGDLTITTKALMLRDRGTVSATSEVVGEAGQITVTAESIELDNQGRIAARTRTVNGGNIRLQAQDLILRGGSTISTSAGDSPVGGNGGNIIINTDNLIALEGSAIFATAFSGNGGNIQVNTVGLFLSPDSVIDASSRRGINGVVDINTPDVDPSQGLAKFPGEPVSNEDVAEGCQAAGQQSSLAISGRGGLAPNPDEPVSSSEIWEDVALPTHISETLAGASTSRTTTPKKLVEAQGWLINEKGDVVLVAQMPSTLSQSRCRLR